MRSNGGQEWPDGRDRNTQPLSCSLCKYLATRGHADIAAGQSSVVTLFEKVEIDVCALADESLREACSELQLSLDQILEKLQECHDLGRWLQ